MANCPFPSTLATRLPFLWVANSQILKSQLSESPSGIIPQQSKLLILVFGSMTAENQRCRALDAELGPPRHGIGIPCGPDASPGYFWPQPRIFPRSFAEPRGSCARAGKKSSISSLVHMKPLPVSASPSSARSELACSALNTMNNAKDAVPSPPPDTSLGRAPILAAASLTACSSDRNKSIIPPRFWPLTTAKMSKKRVS
mmetsp:Transcript_12932/g.31115  ORF Transcript_12932/g.31115 Transcript_12932/m.31115 type:complete len:200 (+) Transcript_12932:1273-1872(+)